MGLIAGPPAPAAAARRAARAGTCLQRERSLCVGNFHIANTLHTQAHPEEPSGEPTNKVKPQQPSRFSAGHRGAAQHPALREHAVQHARYVLGRSYRLDVFHQPREPLP
jgi:hypothetical protein